MPDDCQSPDVSPADDFHQFTRCRSPRFRPRADSSDSDDVECVLETQLVQDTPPVSRHSKLSLCLPHNKRQLAPWTLVGTYESKDADLATMAQLEADESGWSKGQRYTTTQEYKCGISKRFSGCPLKARIKTLPDGRCLLERVNQHDHRPENDKSKGVKWAARKVLVDMVHHRAVKPKHMT